ncbi:MAG: membrane protein insertion efficiency factor YidD [Epsilonproteobacteria bacterium]|nr:membrane protein insertion efficiency factor YidD [Campylobacterota bacterium]
MLRKPLSAALRFYQKYLTLLGFGSCRYYPTCSEYAKWQLSTNPSLFQALLHTFLRILRCNQLFDGGIDYPKISCSVVRGATFGKVSRIRYWFVPRSRGCLVVKNIFQKGSQ